MLIAGEPQDRQRREYDRAEDDPERVPRMLFAGRYLLGELIKLHLDGFDLIGDRTEFRRGSRRFHAMCTCAGLPCARDGREGLADQ